MPLSASGSGGIEASLVNTLEEGDEAIICVNGWFSDRMAEIAGTHPRKGYEGRSALRHHR